MTRCLLWPWSITLSPLDDVTPLLSHTHIHDQPGASVETSWRYEMRPWKPRGKSVECSSSSALATKTSDFSIFSFSILSKLSNRRQWRQYTRPRAEAEYLAIGNDYTPMICVMASKIVGTHPPFSDNWADVSISAFPSHTIMLSLKNLAEGWANQRIMLSTPRSRLILNPFPLIDIS